jgi:hypothetical protein
MYTDDVLLDKIEDFLQGKLSEKDAIDFENQIKSDSKLAETVEKLRLHQQGVELLFKQELKTKMQAWEKASPMALLPKGVPFWLTLKFWLINLLAFLSLVGCWFFWPKNLKKKEQIQQEQPKNADQVGVDNLDQKLKEFYRIPTDLEKDPLMSVQTDQNTNNLPITDRKQAHIYLQNSKYEEAAAIFQKEVNQYKAGTTAKEESEWYLLLSLSHDYANHKEQVNDLMRQILANKEHTYKDKTLKINTLLHN